MMHSTADRNWRTTFLHPTGTLLWKKLLGVLLSSTVCNLQQSEKKNFFTLQLPKKKEDKWNGLCFHQHAAHLYRKFMNSYLTSSVASMPWLKLTELLIIKHSTADRNWRTTFLHPTGTLLWKKKTNKRASFVNSCNLQQSEKKFFYASTSKKEDKRNCLCFPKHAVHRYRKLMNSYLSYFQSAHFHEKRLYFFSYHHDMTENIANS